MQSLRVMYVTTFLFNLTPIYNRISNLRRDGCMRTLLSLLKV
jgi:hypothetical protein